MTDTPNPVARRAELMLRDLLDPATAATVIARLDEARCLARPADRITAPHPVFVRRTGLGAELSMDSLVGTLLAGLAAESVEDPDGVAAELAAIAAASGPERDALLEELLERLGGASVRLASRDARHLAERLLAAAGPAFPNQQDRSAA